MAIKTLNIGNQGPFKYDDQELIDDPDGLFSGVKQGALVTDGKLEVTVVDTITIDGLEVIAIYAAIATTEAKSYFFGLF